MSTEPTTKAGRALFTDIDPMDMWESNGVTPEDIAAIEAEARQQERERIAAAVRALPAIERMLYAPERRAFDVNRAAVLAAITGEEPS